MNLFIYYYTTVLPEEEQIICISSMLIIRELRLPHLNRTDFPVEPIIIILLTGI